MSAQDEEEMELQLKSIAVRHVPYQGFVVTVHFLLNCLAAIVRQFHANVGGWAAGESEVQHCVLPYQFRHPVALGTVKILFGSYAVLLTDKLWPTEWCTVCARLG